MLLYLQHINHNTMLINAILSLLAPYECLSCSIEGKLLCDWCRIDAIPPLPPRCYRCRKITKDFSSCAKCRPKSRLAHVWVVSEYEGISKMLISRLKFERAADAANEIAELIAARLPYLPAETVVTFVPTATSRRRQRGYDQSELIAKRLARLKGLKFSPLLLRIGQSRQVGANRSERQRQLQGAFRVRSLSKVKDAHILVIDDIVTTGATLEAAAQVLKSSGARQINAATFAQKL